MKSYIQFEFVTICLQLTVIVGRSQQTRFMVSDERYRMVQMFLNYIQMPV